MRVRRPYCSVCDTGYAKSADQDCVICEETSLVATQIYFLVGSSIFVVIVGAFLKTYYKVSVLAKFAVLFEGLMDDIKTKMKILMMFGQVSCFPLRTIATHLHYQISLRRQHVSERCWRSLLLFYLFALIC